MAFGPEMCVTTQGGDVFHMGTLPGQAFDLPDADQQELYRELGSFDDHTEWIITAGQWVVGTSVLAPYRKGYPELCVFISEEWQNKGYGTAAMRAAVKAAFAPEAGIGLPVLYARVLPGNHASRRALAKAMFYDVPAELCPRGSRYLELEQINPLSPQWEIEHRVFDRQRAPAVEEAVLATRRAQSLEVVTSSAVHVCAAVACRQSTNSGG